jgi:hypothetical protein
MPNAAKPPFSIRRWYTYEEEILATEMHHPADGNPVRKIVVGACIRNPFAHGEFAPDLSEIVEQSPALGQAFGERLLKALGSDSHSSVGKACLVGLNGEYEHGNAFLTAAFANPLRDVLGGGKAWIPSTGKRGGPMTPIDIPLAHKHALYVRSHYDTVTVAFPDGPNPDEVLVLMAVATRGRLQARLGGLNAADIKANDGLY